MAAPIESPVSGTPLGLSPSSKLSGALRPPGSKSEGQRALIAALFAHGTTRIAGLPDGADVTAALALVRDAGGDVLRIFEEELISRSTGTAVSVTGCPPHGLGSPGGPSTSGLAPNKPLQLGESGTLARIATAAFGLSARPGARVLLMPKGSLITRGSRALFRSLEEAGVSMRRQNLPGTWPIELECVTAPSTLRLSRPTSSQEVSALLIAAAAWPDAIDVVVEGAIPSLPYVGITRRLLEEFAAPVEEFVEVADGQSARRTYRVGGPLMAPPGPLFLESDASSAAVALAAACLSGGSLSIPGLTRQSPQGDVRIVDHLDAFGCDTRADADGLHAKGFPTRGANLDLRGEPDLAPVLASVAAAAALRLGATSVLSGLETLPGKESDRIAVLAQGLGAAGLAVETGPDRMHIARADAPGPSGALTLDAKGDHRMAFAFALLGLVADGVYVGDPGCVAKSWRSFWKDLAAVGAIVRPRAVP